MKVALAIGAVVLGLVLAPWPLPIQSDITSFSVTDKYVEFYSKPSGVVGLVSGDNPWVYARVSDKRNTIPTVERVWADTNCDGVERLSKQLGFESPACVEATHAF